MSFTNEFIGHLNATFPIWVARSLKVRLCRDLSASALCQYMVAVGPAAWRGVLPDFFVRFACFEPFWFKLRDYLRQKGYVSKKIQDWILKSKNGFCVSVVNRFIQDHSGHGTAKEPKNSCSE